MKLVNLFEICSPKQWKTISGNEILKKGKFPVYGANGIIGYYDAYNHEHETLLITCRGATCGTLNVSVPKSYVNGNAMALDDLSDNVDLKFLYYSLLVRGFNDVISGSAQPQITREGLQKVFIPLFPLSTQKAIAEKLDKADALRKKDKELLAQYDELAQAVFIDMFGDPVRNEKGWDKKKLGDLCTKVTDGVHAKPNYTEEGVPFISVKDITTGELKFDKCKFISEEDHEKYFRRCNPELGDILYTKVGATYGRPAIVNTIEPFSLYVSVALLKPKHNLIKGEFFKNIMQTDYVKMQADKSIKGVGVPDLHLNMIREFDLIVPPIKLQEEYISLISNIEAQKSIVKQQAQQSEDLFQALLQESFNFNKTYHEKPQTALSGA